jgi:OmpA-OmpF porin, OOP family
VEIAGHTDNTGKAESNKTLSEKRAEAVKAYLVKKKVAAERLSTVGFGQEQPIGENTNAAGKAKNRRVEFKISQ